MWTTPTNLNKSKWSSTATFPIWEGAIFFGCLLIAGLIIREALLYLLKNIKMSLQPHPTSNNQVTYVNTWFETRQLTTRI